MSKEIIAYEPQPSSLDEVSVHVQRRSRLFLSRLENSAHAVNEFKRNLDIPPYWVKVGFDRVTIDQNGSVIKRSSDDTDPIAFFTGRSFCELASLSLRDGLRQFVQDSRFQFDLYDVWTSLDAENWDVNTQKTGSLHHIVRAIDRLDSSGKALFFDPTYAQIDYRYSGQIVTLSDNELGNFYSGAGSLGEGVHNPSLEMLLLKVKSGGFTKEMYGGLVSAIR